jgi:D-glycerate 3-kinase
VSGPTPLACVEPRWHELGLRGDCALWLDRCGLPLAEALSPRAMHGVLLAGVAGAQGTGKSSACQLLVPLLAGAYALRTLVLSLDDFYLSKAERARLAHDVHPLLATRGVPGTHDVAHLHACLRKLRAADSGSTLELPCFSKARDDRLPETRCAHGRFDVVLLEGWCVGARPQSEAQLAAPCNALEAQADPDGRFRRYVNQQLCADYRALYAELAALVFFAAPDMASVFSFRRQQEAGLRQDERMTDGELARFIAHFERLSVHMLQDAPGYADVVIQLDEARQVARFQQR